MVLYLYVNMCLLNIRKLSRAVPFLKYLFNNTFGYINNISGSNEAVHTWPSGLRRWT